MKKIVFVLLLFLLASSSVISVKGISEENDITLTPNGTSIDLSIYPEEYQEGPFTDTYAKYDDLYPLATHITPPSTKYNCHSFAWLNKYGENVYRNYWLDDPSPFYLDGSYHEVVNPRINDIICYFDDKGTEDKSDDENIHSGIVIGLSGATQSNNVCGAANTVIVRSKWSYMSVFEHRGDYCIYTSALPSSTSKAEYVKFYRPRTHASYTISDYKSLVKDIFFTSEEDDNTNNYEMYELSSEYTKSYSFTISSSILFDVKLYKQNMEEIETIIDINPSNYILSFDSTLNSSEIYYLKVISTNNDTGTISVKIESNSNKVLTIGSNSIYTNKYANTANYIFNNTYGTGLYKVSLSSNISTYAGLLTIYDNEYKTNPMNRLTTSTDELDAITSANSNNLVVYLEFGETYYIDVSLPYNDISSLRLNIELIDDEYIIDVSEESSFDVMTDETQLGDNFVKLDIVYQSVFYIDYDYNGIQEETIYFVLYKEVYNTETQKYELQLVFPELLVTNGESFVWSSVLSSGTYYIGYYNKLNTQSTISIGIGA